MSAKDNRLRAVVGAFVWLQATSLCNNLRQRVLRLRQPKYLLGALAGGAYFYFFLFRHRLHAGSAGARTALEISPENAAFFASLGALALAVIVLVDWGFSGARAKLTFSETEIAFLFPAPLTRTTLIHYALLRAQLGIFFSAFLLSVLFHRGSLLGTGSLQYATGLWLLLSMFNLHLLGASFTRDRLLDLGVRPWLRRTAALLGIVLAAVALWWSMRSVLHWPSADQIGDGNALRAWFAGILATAPLAWLLVPFRWVVAPIFATDAGSFLRALGPGLLLLAAHYVWVVRAQVAFEDASIEHARRRSARLAALRQGRLRERGPTKPRGEPFKLAARGFAPLAFLWKGLIAMGPMYRLRTWLIAAAVAFGFCRWMDADPIRRHVLAAVGVAIVMIGTWILLLGPMMMQRSLRRTIEQMDILKATPLRGWQIALGELLTPMAVMGAGIWLVLLVGEQAGASRLGDGLIAQTPVLAAAVALALIALPLCGLMLCVPFAGMLWLPAWTAVGDGSRGVEAMGQRLVFMGGYLLVLALALIPAGLAGGIGFLLGRWLGGRTAAVLVAAVFACAALAFELACAVDLLGRRIDRFDVSQELR